MYHDTQPRTANAELKKMLSCSVMASVWDQSLQGACMCLEANKQAIGNAESGGGEALELQQNPLQRHRCQGTLSQDPCLQLRDCKDILLSLWPPVQARQGR